MDVSFQVAKKITYSPAFSGDTVDVYALFSKSVLADSGQLSSVSLAEYNALNPIIKSKASLVIAPLAYKSGTVYGMNPQTGAVIPVTFTRASTASRSNSLGVLEAVASGMPRIEYNPVTLAVKGYLFEKASTNIFNYSEQFDNAYWTKEQSTITANAAIAPDGTMTADKFVVNSQIAEHDFYKGVTTGNYTASIYLKAAGRNWAYLALTTGTGTGVYFDLVNGVVGNVGAGNTASITAVRNGWFRCSITRDASGIFIFASTIANGNFTDQGDSVSGTYLWGAQIEVSSFATSYIPVVASASTRAVDVASINQTTGTVLEVIDGVKKAYVYSGGNKTTFTSGVKGATITEAAPTSYAIKEGTTRTAAIFASALSDAEAISITA